MEFIENTKGQKYPPAKSKWVVSDDIDAFEEGCSIKIEEDEIVIDIDVPSEGAHAGSKNVGLTTEKILKIIEYFGIETEYWLTNNGGAHLVFLRPDDVAKTRLQNGICALGIHVEYKPQKAKTHCVKTNGKAYKGFNIGVRKPLPDIFRKKSKSDWFPEILSGMKEGSRNDTLFRHSANMPDEKFDNKSKRRILTFINEHLFDTPLTGEELERMVELKGRDENIAPEINIAKEMVKVLNPIHHVQQLYFRHPRFGYVPHAEDTQFDVRTIIDKYHPNLLSKKMKEIEYQFARRSEKTDPTSEFHLNLANGMLYKGQFVELNNLDFSPYNVRHRYDPNAEPVEVVDNYLDFISWDDKDTRKTILEMIAGGLITEFDVKGSMKKFFKIRGTADSGKGTLLQVIAAIIGRENITTVKPNELDNEKSKATLLDKLFCLGDDVRKGTLNEECSEVTKNLVSCDWLNVKRVYKEGIDVRVVATMIFTTNHTVKWYEKDPDFEKKQVTIPLTRQPEKKDKDLAQKLTSPKAIAYWMKLLVEAYMELYARGEYFISERVKLASQAEAEKNVNTLLFLNDFEEVFTKETLMGYPVDYIYNFYVAWCMEQNGEEAPRNVSKETFAKNVANELGITTTRIQFHRSYGTTHFFVDKKDEEKKRVSDLSRKYPRIVKGQEPIELSEHTSYMLKDGVIVRNSNHAENSQGTMHMSMYDHAMDARPI